MKKPGQTFATRALPILLVLSSMTSIARADVRTEARRHFRRGMELVVQGQLDAGVAELEEAYAILPHPNVLFNIARAFAEAGRYDEALEYFDRYLETDPPDRVEVAGFVQALRVRIAERDAAQARTATTEAGVESTTTTTTTTTTPTTATTPTPTFAGGARVTDEEIAALHESAAQFESLASATGSETLRRRAERLRALAADLEAARAAAASTTSTHVATTTPTETAPTETAPTETAAPSAGITLGTGQTGMYEEEVVSASRYAQNPLDAPNATTIITRQDIRLSGLTSVGELLRRAAGVQVMNTGSADTNVGIRGFNQALSPRVLVLLNGRSVYIDPLGITWYSTLPIGVEDIERIEVIRGPASALYGANGFSGIVNIITRAPGDTSEVQAVASGGNGRSARTYLSLSGRSHGFGYRMSASYQQFDRNQLAEAPGRVGTYYPVVDSRLAHQAVTARGHISYRINPTVSLNVEGGMNYFGQSSLLGTGSMTNLYADGSISYALANLQSSWGGIRVFWNRMDARADMLGRSPLRNVFLWNTLDAEATFARAFDTGRVNHNLTLGAGYRLKTIEWNKIDANHQEHHFSAFFQDAIRLSEGVRAVVGFRMDRHPLLAHPVWSPRAALVFRPTEGQAIRMSVSSAFRTQTMLESYIEHNVQSPVSAVGGIGIGSVPTHALRGVAPLRPERILSAEVGYTNAESEHITIELSAYYNRVRDLVTLSTTTVPFTLADYANPVTSRLASFDRAANLFTYGTNGYTNDASLYDVFGGELGVRLYPIDGLDIYANAATNITYADRGGDRDSDRVRSRATPLLQVNSGIQYRSRFGLDVASDFSFQTATVWDEQVTDASGVVYQAFHLPAYYLLNARVGYRLLDDALELAVSGYNITNAHFRQFPFAQQLESRVMGSVSYRF